MAINLWKVGGKSTSYNPLPLGTSEMLSTLTIGTDYLIILKAKSDSGASIRISGYSNTYKDIALTSSLTNYEIPFTAKEIRVVIHAPTYKNDIIIEDIQLVQKPLPKFTINGISGEVEDWEQGSLGSTNGFDLVDDTRIRSKQMTVPKGSTVVLKVESGFDYSIREYNGTNFVSGTTVWNNGSTVFALSQNTTFLRVIVRKNDNSLITPADITKVKPMLNLGTTPAPYSKKTGDKMVLPTVKGNLFDGQLKRGYSINSGSGAELLLAGWSMSPNYMKCKGNTSYSINTAEYTYVYYYDSNFALLSTTPRSDLGLTTRTFTTPSNTVYMRFNVRSETETNIMLNEGTQPQPYTPYAVQVNKKPKRYVPKKNLFDGYYEVGGITTSSTGADDNTATNRKRSGYIPVKPNTAYTVSNDGTFDLFMHEYGRDKVSVGALNVSNSLTVGNISKTFVTGNNTYLVRFRNNNEQKFSNWQLEEGTTATPYEPYQLVLPQAKTGLAFNGVSDYLQLPSMTMDSVEIECLIAPDSEQKAWATILDARHSFSASWVGKADGIGYGWSKLIVNGVEKSKFWSEIPKSERTKLKFVATNSFMDDVTMFTNVNLAAGNFLKATLYKVTCYLNGAVVATYDFENPGNIVGDKVIPNAKNLIPSFEDARWSLHANADVLGKDVLRLEASGQYQYSTFDMNIPPNTTFLVTGSNILNQYYKIILYDSNGANLILDKQNFSLPYQFTSSSNTAKIRFHLGNTSTGTYDFIKPQLYELTGKEGTILGAPSKMNKASKRSLFAKR